jgi:glyoxylase-like metal-dependent hydrolase (beta-lactamase superfamily II)
VSALRLVRDGLWAWQAYEPAVKCDLSASAVLTADGVILVDPFPFEEPLPFEKPAAIFLTNGNHARAADALRTRYGVPVFAPPEAVAELGIAVDGAPSLGGVRVIALPGAGPGEVAYLFGRVLCLGDAVIHLPDFGFGILPDKYCNDPAKLRDSLRKLLSLEFDILTFAHGAPILHDARQRLSKLIA